MNCIVLLSGGVDSAACVHFYLSQNFSVRGMHVTYGQPSARSEEIAATAVAGHYQIPLTHVKLLGGRTKSDGEILGRNGFLLFAALMELDIHAGLIAIGIHSGTSYHDCSPSFLSSAQTIFNGQCDGRIQIAAPFLGWTKKDIVDYCTKHHVPIQLTYSCERGHDQPCGICRSCKDLEASRVC